MTGLRDTIQREVSAALYQPWVTRVGTVVPSSETVALNRGRVDLRAVLLYADLADSTVIAIANREAAARLFRAYLALCARLIVRRGGEIRSFDGDRIMAVFVGVDASTSAVCAGLEINWCFQALLTPLFQAQYPMFVTGGYRLAQAVGIDGGDISVVRGGIRANNDIVWIGRAPNVAAKLSNLRVPPYATFVSEDLFQSLPSWFQFAPGTPVLFWDNLQPGTIPVANIRCTRWWLPLA